MDPTYDAYVSTDFRRIVLPLQPHQKNNFKANDSRETARGL